VPNYCVSLAEIIVPASELSQHISTAGMEASGTSNMKFAMNGGLIIGTLDGANIEIREEIGKENMFHLWRRAKDVPELRRQVREGRLRTDSRFKEVLAMIQLGTFGPAETFGPILQCLDGPNDYYLLAHDFVSYLDAQERVDATYKNPALWNRMSILSTYGAAHRRARSCSSCVDTTTTTTTTTTGEC